MPSRPRLLILGASGRLGATLAAHWTAAGGTCLGPPRAQADLSRPDVLAAALSGLDFDVLVNAAALTSPDLCEDEPDLALRVNAESPGRLAALCAARGARCIHLSTDYVFAGAGSALLDEAAPAEPVNAYGRSKRAGELAVLAADPAALVARVSWLFGPQGGDVPATVLARARAGEPLGFIEDKWSVPTSTVEVAAWLERLATDLAGVSGLLHLCNTGAATWRDYAQVVLDRAWARGLLDRRHWTHGQKLRDFPNFKARRPPFTAMSNARLADLLGAAPAAWQEALDRHLQTLAAA